MSPDSLPVLYVVDSLNRNQEPEDSLSAPQWAENTMPSPDSLSPENPLLPSDSLTTHNLPTRLQTPTTRKDSLNQARQQWEHKISDLGRPSNDQHSHEDWTKEKEALIDRLHQINQALSHTEPTADREQLLIEQVEIEQRLLKIRQDIQKELRKFK
ncbi:MAG: hypothetical protein HC880_05035 [Bacteroidia bacterium]|nr:hypothetical protein [Bacteroidia bacterium]